MTKLWYNYIEDVRTVEVETTIAQGLHTTDDSAGYDAACKRVLSEKAILARIMKACLAEYQDCNVNDIAVPGLVPVRGDVPPGGL